jgi:two-component system response regulator HydG
VDVRIVAATNKDLGEEVEAGRFREDLYYRLNVIAITLPPLRARPDDIPLLSDHFLKMFAERNGRERVPHMSRAAEDALVRYSWPGNVRELQNIIERAVVLDKDGIVDVDDLPDTVANSADEVRHLNIPLGTPLAEVERRVIQETLRMTKGDKKLASQLLGIATRTIYRKI